MKKNCFARMRSLFKAASGSDAPAAGASSSEKSLLRFKRLFFKPIDYEVFLSTGRRSKKYWRSLQKPAIAS